MSSFAFASFLNVYSEKQGGKNLTSLLSSVPFLLLTALYFLCYGLLNLDAQGADTRDIFDDFRLTLPASSIMHWWGNATVNQVPPPEVSSAAFDAVPLKRNQRVVEGVGDPRSYFISGSQLAMFVPKTQNAHMSFSGNVRSSIGSSASAPATWSAATGWTVPSQLISVFVAVPTRNTSVTQSVRSQRFSRIVSRQTPSGVVSYAVADVEVALVSLRTGTCQCCLHLLRPSYTTIFDLISVTDASGVSLQAHALSDVMVEVAFASATSMPALVRVHSKYQLQPLQSFPAKSPSTSASLDINGGHYLIALMHCAMIHRQLAGLDTVSFTVHVLDVNQPRPFIPNFAFSFQAFKAPLCLPVTLHRNPVAVGCSWCCSSRIFPSLVCLVSLPPLLGGGQQREGKHRQSAHLLCLHARVPWLVAADSPTKHARAAALYTHMRASRWEERSVRRVPSHWPRQLRHRQLSAR